MLNIMPNYAPLIVVLLTALLEYIDLFIKIVKTVTHYARKLAYYALCFGMPIMLKTMPA